MPDLPDHLADEYTGPARIVGADLSAAVTVTLHGRFEPVDGRYHWGGRVAPHPELELLLREGKRAVTIQLGHQDPTPARLVEVDPWSGLRLQGVGRPPWASRV
jgi:hypothetical protein